MGIWAELIGGAVSNSLKDIFGDYYIVITGLLSIVVLLIFTYFFDTKIVENTKGNSLSKNRFEKANDLKHELINLLKKGDIELVFANLKRITSTSRDKGLGNRINTQQLRFNEIEPNTKSLEVDQIKVKVINKLSSIINDLSDDYVVNVIFEESLKEEKRKLKNIKIGSIVTVVILLIFLIIRLFSGCEKEVAGDTFDYIPPYSRELAFAFGDSTHFNILITQFEDKITGDDAECIGRSIEDKINVIAANSDLPLKVRALYLPADSVRPPRSQAEAIFLQEKNFADLIIYGLARNIEEACQGAEICFRYKIGESIIKSEVSNPIISTSKHDSNYDYTTPIEIDEGKLRIDRYALQHWISCLTKYKANSFEDAFDELEQMVDEKSNIYTNEEISDQLNNRAHIYTSLKDYDKAFIDYGEAIRLDSNDYKKYTNRGNLHRQLKQYTEALEDQNKALELDSTKYLTLNNRGIVYFEMELFQKALNDFNKSIKLKPDFGIAYLNRGNVFKERKEDSLSIIDFTKAIDFDPSMSVAYHNRGNAFNRMGEYDKAILNYQKAIELNPNEPVFYRVKAYAFRNSEKYLEAIKEFTNSINIDPDFMRNYKDRGFVYLMSEDYENAINDLTLYLKIKKNDAYGYNNLAYCYLKINQTKLAYQMLFNSESLNNKNSWLYRNKSCYYSLLGNNDLALQNFEKAIELGYEDLEWIETEELLNPIRREPRFQQAVLKLNKKKK